MGPTTSDIPAELAELAARAGISRVYTDWRGDERRVGDDVVREVLQRMVETAPVADAAARTIPRVLSVFHGEPARLPVHAAAPGSRLVIRLEDGTGRPLGDDLGGDHEIELPADLPEGYHRLLLLSGEHEENCALIVAPARCHEPQRLGKGGRVWGVALQLYALRSEDDWGIGDFGTLRAFIREAAALGVDAVGLNPLHALYRDDPERCSPYGPGSREFLNPLYVDVTAVAELAECEPVRRHVESVRFRSFLGELRASSHVDYPGVADAKLGILRRLFGHFSREHLLQGSPRAREFGAWCREQGRRLLDYATWEALRRHFADESGTPDWRRWPAEYRHPGSSAVREFRDGHPGEVAFGMYLQWLAASQLEDARGEAQAAGMSVGLYLDIALGTPPDSAEGWMDEHLYVEDTSIGAPPDELALKGQDWGLAPISPPALTEAGMEPWRRLLAASMRYAGAIRLDHVMSLMRLWWVPAGREATDGLYVAYPMQDLLAVLTLESRRNRCLVIGEDLGTVAPEIRGAMREHGLYSYGVLYFEKEDDRQFRRPPDFPARCLVAVSTHDLPTLAAYWEDTDIEERRRLGLFPDERMADEVAARRAWDRGALLYALQREGLLPQGMATDPATVPVMTRPLALAIEAYLARSAARLLVVQPEDWLLMYEAVNIPGTGAENPNWRRRLALPWQELLERPEVRESCRRISEERGRP